MRLARPLFYHLFEIDRLGALLDLETLKDLEMAFDGVQSTLDRLSLQERFPTLAYMALAAIYSTSYPLRVDQAYLANTKFADMRAANAEIDLTSLSQCLSIASNEAAFDYVTSLLSTDPPTEETLLLNLLPYILKSSPTSTTLPIHLQRALEFLGPHIEHVRIMCGHRRILNDSLSVDQFFALVSLAERSGVQSQDFQNALGAVEKGIHAVLSERAEEAESRGQVDEEAEIRLEGMLNWSDWNFERSDYPQSPIEQSEAYPGGNQEAEEMRDMAEESIGRVRTREGFVDRNRFIWRRERCVFRKDLDLDFL
ncbi:hypothetical protein DL98DRAFT_27990 [Cadophora sp. DSE1049]|nr:hypothetical protein DL98DRAFT_27990 [Cadophora sp. DSE1049]